MKTRYKVLAIIILGITFVSVGFGVLYLSPGLHPDPRLPNAEKLEPKYDTKSDTVYDNPTDIPSANNNFALNFYSHAKEDGKNIFFSPISIFTAFGIAYEGANGITADEMQQVFGFSNDDIKRKKEFQNILSEFENSGLLGLKPEYTLHMANALWIANHFEPQKEYIDTADTYYYSKIDKVDFSTSSGANTINDWVKTQTQDKIQDLIKPENTDELTALVITNAIYFQGDWVYQFNPSFTQQANFHINEKETVKVQMMDLDKPILNYAENDLLQIIQLPYKGDKISMLLLLPKEYNGLNTLEKNLTVENISQWKNSLEKKMTGVYIPKFTATTEYDLKEMLMSMGVNTAFDNNHADFSGISESDPIYIDSAIHQAFVSVDEKGTEAAAATGINARLQSGPPNTFRADHPFVFIIQDDSNDNILFIGRIVNPLQ